MIQMGTSLERPLYEACKTLQAFYDKFPEDEASWTDDFLKDTSEQELKELLNQLYWLRRQEERVSKKLRLFRAKNAVAENKASEQSIYPIPATSPNYSSIPILPQVTQSLNMKLNDSCSPKATSPRFTRIADPTDAPPAELRNFRPINEADVVPSIFDRAKAASVAHFSHSEEENDFIYTVDGAYACKICVNQKCNFDTKPFQKYSDFKYDKSPFMILRIFPFLKEN